MIFEEPTSARRTQGVESRNAATLIDDLLSEQRELTAVETFSRAHDAGAVRTHRYRDLLPASAPASGQQYAFEVDLDKCSGCKACVTACHSLNGLDENETWRSVGLLVGDSHVPHPAPRNRTSALRTPHSAFQQNVTTACHHCVDPGCLNGCPVLAYDKDPVTGIVRHLDDQCIGCQYCVMKCPYEVPQYLPSRGIVRKCDLCSSRLAVGEAPACVQACPSEAITITVVEQAKVRGMYRQLPNPSITTVAGGKVGKWESGTTAGLLSHFPTFSLSHFQKTNVSVRSNDFLPASPNPAITLPTTRYVTQRILPANLDAADAHDVQPSKAHPPLTFMLVLSQLGVGLALLGALAGGRSRATVLAALVTTLVAVVAGTLHLGQPLKAWRGFLGWRKSWFSRELIAFAAFIAALTAHRVILHPLSSILAASCGLAAVACSAMVYVDTRRPFWNTPMTFGKFFGTTLLLGTLASAPAGFSGANPNPQAGMPAFPVIALALFVIGAIVKLAAENRIFRFLVDEQHPQLTALNKTALLLTGRFGLLARVRVACLVVSGIIFPVLVLNEQWTATTRLIFATIALALCLAGELIERHLFFVAEVAPKMPGGGAA